MAEKYHRGTAISLSLGSSGHLYFKTQGAIVLPWGSPLVLSPILSLLIPGEWGVEVTFPLY